ncbi:MAG: nucleobase:cation symporter, family [Gaiellaceae bacterium]|jgi:NCS1 family nucleobase:cation symporter-1|nr:nucleobase:cation symporter, family [Gaiellaceae bacterium]
MSADTPSWGIEPVPERLRILGFLDTFLLWGNLSVSLLVIVAGAFLVPALSLGGAFAAILVAGIVGNAMLGVAGMIGADARVPAMVVLRAPLGRRGSLLPTALNVLQCLGWSVFELIIIATAASALSQQVFGFGGKPLWTIVMGAIATGLAFMGPVGFVRRYVRKFAVYFVVASLAYLAWWAVHGQHVGALWSKPGNGHDAFWPGVDLVLASIVSWTPLAADYTRFARDRRTAFWGVAIGYLLPTVGLFLLGAILMLTRDLGDAAAIPTAVAAGGLASILALLALTVDESDEAFANVYSGAVSLQNAFPRAPQRLLIAGVAAVATAGALVIDLRNYQDFLFLLGSFFVPLFGVLLADWLLAGRHYDADVLFHGPAVRPELIASWLAGFALYQWLAPVGPSWWTSIVEHAHPSSLPFGGASLPSFAAAFLLALAAGSVARRRVVLA